MIVLAKRLTWTVSPATGIGLPRDGPALHLRPARSPVRDATTDPDGLHDETLAPRRPAAQRSGLTCRARRAAWRRPRRSRPAARPTASRARCASRAVAPVVTTSSHTTTYARGRAGSAGASARGRTVHRAGQVGRPLGGVEAGLVGGPARDEQRATATDVRTARCAQPAAAPRDQRRGRVVAALAAGAGRDGTGTSRSGTSGRAGARAAHRRGQQVAQRRGGSPSTGRGPCGRRPSPGRRRRTPRSAHGRRQPGRRPAWATRPGHASAATRGRPGRASGRARAQPDAAGRRGTGRGRRRAPRHAQQPAASTGNRAAHRLWRTVGGGSADVGQGGEPARQVAATSRSAAGQVDERGPGDGEQRCSPRCHGRRDQRPARPRRAVEPPVGDGRRARRRRRASRPGTGRR